MTDILARTARKVIYYAVILTTTIHVAEFLMVNTIITAIAYTRDGARGYRYKANKISFNLFSSRKVEGVMQFRLRNVQNNTASRKLVEGDIVDRVYFEDGQWALEAVTGPYCHRQR